MTMCTHGYVLVTRFIPGLKAQPGSGWRHVSLLLVAFSRCAACIPPEGHRILSVMYYSVVLVCAGVPHPAARRWTV